ncbi:DNA gyrase inhibitor GyrI [Dysgonomonas alginatilytica]|uniref:DNA gyrase inhibitor GyrI n=1 Tax=Dysgonomonas alginatilytica TaxID=1605892 RepID=A0A2V3PIY1_9BACT|nr:GyrI-like domain-containing protein [Dysgonomonas alginatilytica]PXV58939.1 DNA gyrase inhibitor GyrI [Dysgonomonas alginatilytica]
MKINSTEIKNLEPIKTIAVSHLGDYSGIGPAFEKLCVWAGENALWAASPRMAGVYHDDPTHIPAESLRSEACLEDLSGIEPSEGMKQYTISGGKYFVMQVEINMSECGDAWKKVYDTFNEKGYEYDMRDHYDLYQSCTGDMEDPDAPWVVDLCIPMK